MDKEKNGVDRSLLLFLISVLAVIIISFVVILTNLINENVSQNEDDNINIPLSTEDGEIKFAPTEP